MTEDEYISAIVTIISSYRAKELEHPLDKKHVFRWLSQFDEKARYVVIKEMFHILSRNYKKCEEIKRFLKRILDYFYKKGILNNVVLVNTQNKGESQKILYDLICRQCEEEYKSICIVIDTFEKLKEHKIFAYIDDGLYTGGRAKEDLFQLVRALPEGSELYVFYMVAYNNALQYCKRIISEEAMRQHVIVEIMVMEEKNNIRNKESENIDFIWPNKNGSFDITVSNYEDRLKQTGKANYLYDWYSYKKGKPGLFSDYESRNVVEKVFLEYGILISDKLNTSRFRPLGITNTPSFGFGSVFVTDYNISNTCPLVLWWGSPNGSIENGDALNCWYPLFPRRTNKETYEKIREYEDQFSLKQYKDILWTVYRLAEIEKDEWSIEKSTTHVGRIDLSAIRDKRERSELLQYMRGLDMRAIKVIQTVMYIGRDYRYSYYCDDAGDDWLEGGKDKSFHHNTDKKIVVDNPDEVLLAWMNDLKNEGDWKEKNIEINQIYEKGPLSIYMKRAFEILGLDE